MPTRIKIRSSSPSRPTTREAGRVYIDELAKIVDREMGTIRKWERTVLPKRLHSKRGYRGWRYWTDKQVWGEKGIINWMAENDMRPGNLVSDPSKEAQHVRNLRKPKYLDGYHIRSARRFADQGKSRDEIIRKLYPRTRYARPENLEAALVKLFAQEGWYFPPSLGKLQILPDRIERSVKQMEHVVSKFEYRQDARDRTRSMKKSA
jgi:hypothetical protein